MTQIRLTNSATRRKEDFTPLNPGNVRVYVCGPTVYDRAHMGNARPAIVFDVLYRLLRHVYGADHVTYVRNITDVDDKINARADETGRSIREITDETTGWYLDDMAALGNLEPTETPRATDYIDRMIAMIEILVARGHAYEAEGHVLFSVASHDGYGRLSGRSVEDMLAGARVEVAPYKRDPMDFVLWKPSGPDQPGWDSPWGNGRPGWHIECSAMAADLLGARFDIHGGGNDLIFPHHENEIAQSACAHDGAAMAQIWLHNEMLQVEGRKMSKSLGNFFTVRDLLDRGIPGEVVRFVFLGTHYRKPMDWTEEKQIEAEDRLRWYHSIIGKYDDVGAIDTDAAPPDSIIEAVADDLNTHLALVRVHALAKRAETEMRNGSAARDLAVSLQFLGLLNRSAASEPQCGWVDHNSDLSVDDQFKIQMLMNDRREAKKNRNFARADEIRDQLKAAGVILKDTHTGSTYEIMRNFNSEKLRRIV